MGFTNRETATQRGNQGGAAYDNSWKHELRMAPGESVLFRFTSLEGEPFNYDRHSTASRQVRQTICGRSPHGPGTCKMCEAVAQADARNRKQTLVKGAGPRQAYSIVSFRVMFKDVPTIGGDGQVRSGLVARACDDRQRPLKVLTKKVPDGKGGLDEVTYTELYPDGRHEHDGIHSGEFEGLKVLNLSGSKRRPEGAEILKLDAELESQCRCGTLVGDLVKQPASVQVVGHACASCGKRYQFDMNSSAQLRCTCGVVAQPIEILACQANCGNPRRDSILNRFIMITKTGEGLDSALSFKAMPYSDLSPEYAAMLVDAEGNPLRANFEEIYPYSPELEARSLRSIAPQLASLGVKVEQVLQGGSQQPGVPAQGFGGLGGPTLPTLGATPAAVRTGPALPQSPTFPTGSPVTHAPSTPVVPVATTVATNAPPLATSPAPVAGAKVPPPAVKLGLSLHK